MVVGKTHDKANTNNKTLVIIKYNIKFSITWFIVSSCKGNRTIFCKPLLSLGLKNLDTFFT